ncbi:hypothetical protein M2146_001034 [Lachnospiraceae bacterium PF1-22]
MIKNRTEGITLEDAIIKILRKSQNLAQEIRKYELEQIVEICIRENFPIQNFQITYIEVRERDMITGKLENDVSYTFTYSKDYEIYKKKKTLACNMRRVSFRFKDGEWFPYKVVDNGQDWTNDIRTKTVTEAIYKESFYLVDELYMRDKEQDYQEYLQELKK